MDPEALSDVDHVPHGGVTDADLLDFSANINPVRPRGVTQVYDAAFGASTRYHADDYTEFRLAAADYADCEPEHVVPTAGGLIAIRLALGVTVSPGDAVAVPAPSFGEYAREARLQGGDPEFVDADTLLDLDPEPYSVVVVCNPNNPTGQLYPADDLQRFARQCRRADTTLLVDEAFLDFTDSPSIAGTRGVVVARSLTKMFGLPGIRAGYAAAEGDLRERLETARPAWGLSTPAADVGAYCMRQDEFVEETRARVTRERQRMYDVLTHEFDVRESHAPFLLVDVGDRDVQTVAETTRKRGVAVRDATTFRGLDSHIRVAVKRAEENDRLLDALRDV
ncbi:L-threonine O-3-phosphate decarboxylase [Halogranum gelatinilyticum]|uniref:threonine-phosphate decarboxylase n=1 Tax=Halogranum gelatinilyticum TaxID=660521 RepID=A0A1G9Q732_9EURY|nr:threonine-phosphate decarboxylase CobD [Halogranum gelatinilyticum]SDM06872.1 L-threonine O-3-phosphate decarboxylase [Halogranum gelatinilyticum]